MQTIQDFYIQQFNAPSAKLHLLQRQKTAYHCFLRLASEPNMKSALFRIAQWFDEQAEISAKKAGGSTEQEQVVFATYKGLMAVLAADRSGEHCNIVDTFFFAIGKIEETGFIRSEANIIEMSTLLLQILKDPKININENNKRYLKTTFDPNGLRLWLDDITLRMAHCPRSAALAHPALAERSRNPSAESNGDLSLPAAMPRASIQAGDGSLAPFLRQKNSVDSAGLGEKHEQDGNTGTFAR